MVINPFGSLFRKHVRVEEVFRLPEDPFSYIIKRFRILPRGGVFSGDSAETGRKRRALFSGALPISFPL